MSKAETDRTGSATKDEPINRPRILLADDHAPIIERVTAILQSSCDVVGSVGNGADLVSEAARLQPDVIISDISMPGLSGIEAAHEIRAAGSKARLIFLTVHERGAFVRACIAEGALGYVLKSHLNSDLVPALHEVLAGRYFISPSVSQ